MISKIERTRAALAVIPPNLPRDEWHEIGRAAIAAGLTIDDLDEWSSTAENYKGRRDVEAAFRTVTADGGTGAGTLFHHAKQYGFAGASESRPSLPPDRTKQTPQTPAKQAASANAVAVWERCIPATPAEAYIQRKQGKPDGVRVYPASASPLVIRGQNVAGYLAVPCWSGEHLQTLQFIPPNKGDKLNMPGESFNDGFFTVGEITDRVYICEGIGQAWAVNQVTGKAAVVCFGAGRTMTVAKVLRDKYPAASLVICPDRGKEADAAKIAADISGLMVAMPDDAPSNYDCNDYAQEHGTDALADLLQRAQPPLMRFKLLTDDDLAKLPPQQWRVKKVLPETGLAAVFGASGSGKSFAVIDLTQSIAAGRDWFGYKSKPCNVLYCALEGEGGIAGRVAAYRIHHGATSPNIRYLVQPFSLLESGDIHDLAQAIKANGQGAEVVILDTLNRAAPGADENSSVDMGRLIAAAKELQTLIGGLVILVHHTGKDASKGLRGHSSLHAALDVAIEVRRDGDSREWVIAKSKDGEDGEAHPFKLDVVELGTDEDGELITSCVIAPSDGGQCNSNVGETAAKQLIRNSSRLPVLRLIHEFYGRAEWISPSASSPTTNTFAMLRAAPTFPVGIGKRECMELCRELERDGLLTKESYQKPSRHAGDRWRLTPKGYDVIGVPLPPAPSKQAELDADKVKSEEVDYV